MPYISASIILQLMTAVIPRSSGWRAKGEAGRAEDHPVHPLPDPGASASCRATPWPWPWRTPQALLGVSAGRSCMNPGLGLPPADRHHHDHRHDAADVAGRADHRARHRQRHLADHHGQHHQPPAQRAAGRCQHVQAGRRRSAQFTIFHLVGLLLMLFLVMAAHHRGDPGPAEDPRAVRQAGGRPQGLRRAEHVHAAARQLLRRHADHLRPGDPDVPAQAARHAAVGRRPSALAAALDFGTPLVQHGSTRP